MNKPFLKQVADHYHSKGDISSRCFVFPNRRSMVFFRKWLSATVAKAASCGDDKPILAPRMMTINDLFYNISAMLANIKLIVTHNKYLLNVFV